MKLYAMGWLIVIVVILLVADPKGITYKADPTPKIVEETNEKKSDVTPEDRISLMRLTVPHDCSNADVTVKRFAHDHHRSRVIPNCYTRSQQ